MNKKVFCCLLSLLAGAAAGRAQTDPPPPPLVLVPARTMKWTLTIKGDPEAKPTTHGYANEPTSLTIAHDGDLSDVVLTFAKKSPAEYWQVKNMLLAPLQGSPRIVVTRISPGGPEPYPYASTGFYGLGNVKPADEQGKVQFEGAKCRYFRGSGRDTMSGMPDLSGAPTVQQGTYEAWFEFETGLPKGYRVNDKTILYTFLPLKEGELQLPAADKTTLEQTMEAMRRSGMAP